MTGLSDSNESLPEALHTAEQVRAMDDYAINTLGIPGFVLMQNAGLEAFRKLRQRWSKADHITVFCGAGNNGGDGYILARLALEEGFKVNLLALSPLQRLRGDALTAGRAFQSVGGVINEFNDGSCVAGDLVVDGLFGTGLDREVIGRYANAIGLINEFNGPVLALDIPSGIHADTGFPLGVAVQADQTVTFIGLKQGLFTGYGTEYCGRISFSALGVPASVQNSQQPSAVLMPLENDILPSRRQGDHKGDFGHVLVIGGDTGYIGAGRLAAEATARVGAGLVSVATRTCHAAVLNISRPEIMCRGVERQDELLPLLERATVVAIGPGLGRSSWGREMLNAVCGQNFPMVVDADGLNLLAETPCYRDNWILTPHPGEAARLLGTTVEAVQKDRYAAVAAVRKKYGGFCVLKGSGSIVDGPDTVPAVCRKGNPGMASGGMGDVLTGVIAGLLAQNLSLGDAARIGTNIHSAAADRAAKAGQRGLLAGDLMDQLRYLVNQ